MCQDTSEGFLGERSPGLQICSWRQGEGGTFGAARWRPRAASALPGAARPAHSPQPGAGPVPARRGAPPAPCARIIGTERLAVTRAWGEVRGVFLEGAAGGGRTLPAPLPPRSPRGTGSRGLDSAPTAPPCPRGAAACRRCSLAFHYLSLTRSRPRSAYTVRLCPLSAGPGPGRLPPPPSLRGHPGRGSGGRRRRVRAGPRGFPAAAARGRQRPARAGPGRALLGAPAAASAGGRRRGPCGRAPRGLLGRELLGFT